MKKLFGSVAVAVLVAIAWASRADNVQVSPSGQAMGCKSVSSVCYDAALPVDTGGNYAQSAVVSSAAESSHVLKGSAGNLYSLYVTTGATAGFVMVFDATSAPADGAVTPKECAVAPANATTFIDYGGGPPESFATGITAVFSSTGCFTKTASATAFFHGTVQ